MVPSALDYLSADHFTMLHLAHRIEHVLGKPATSIDLQQVAYELIDAHDRLIRPHLEREEQVLLSVIREHAAARSVAIDEAHAQGRLIQDNLVFLRQSLELGYALRGVLEDVEWSLRAYVDHEEKHIIPWAEQVLDKVIMAEVERRFEEATHPPEPPALRQARFDGLS